MTARNANKGAAVVQELNSGSANPVFHFQKLDVMNPGDIDKVYEFVEKEFGHLDVLVNNAGIISSERDSTRVTRAEIQTILDTNFFGPFQLSQRLIPLLEKGTDARIINVSSGMGALEGMQSGYAAYRFSKTALNSLTTAMAADLRLRGIKVMAVDPGWVHTDMGGANAPRTPSKGAASILWPVLNNAVSGKFYRDGEAIPW
jgi:NAD(P)-dependent dehydrogenase (short-subunit alcohol dehydrogenase family)